VSESLKTITVYKSGQYLFRFYWACWSLNVCIVKEHRTTFQVSWKVVRNLPLARDLWGVLIRQAEAIGSKTSIGPDEWGSERIKWVRSELAKNP